MNASKQIIYCNKPEDYLQALKYLDNPERFELRVKYPVVRLITGLERSQFYKAIQDNEYPKPLNPLGGRESYWIEEEIRKAHAKRQKKAVRTA